MPEGRIAAILLGSNDFPLMAEDFSKPAFLRSSLAFKKYLLSESGLNLNESQVLDLFGCSDTVEKQDLIITNFLHENEAWIETLFIHYVGHGGFLSSRQYFLAVKTTDPRRKHFTGFKAVDLAETLRLSAPGKRIYLILDCCFAGAVLETFQADEISTLLQEQTYSNFPALGTTLLAASSRNEPAITPDGGEYTMLAESLLSVLWQGIPTADHLLSLREVSEAAALLIRRKYGLSAVRPEVHTPRQINEDIADIPIFPNKSQHLKLKKLLPAHRHEKYNSDLEPVPFLGWQAYTATYAPGVAVEQFLGHSISDGRLCYRMKTSGSSAIGTNKSLELQRGLVVFSFKILASTERNISFFVIPMGYGQRIGPGRRNFPYEIRPPGEFRSPNPLRALLQPIDSELGMWKTVELPFDFSFLQQKITAVFAPRINEGGRSAGPGHLLFSKVQVFEF